jgi:hypothetical protein
LLKKSLNIHQSPHQPLTLLLQFQQVFGDFFHTPQGFVFVKVFGEVDLVPGFVFAAVHPAAGQMWFDFALVILASTLSGIRK